MEITVPYIPGLLLGRSVDMKNLQLGFMLVGDDINPTSPQVNLKTAQFSFVQSLKDVCDVLSVPLEYALKVKAGLIKNETVSACLGGLGKQGSFTLVFRASFLQQKQYLPPDVIPSRSVSCDRGEGARRPTTESLIADAVSEIEPQSLESMKHEHGTHWVKAVEIGNELITVLKISCKDKDKFQKLFYKLCECLQAHHGLLDDTKLVELQKVATEFDKKLQKKHYEDVNLEIQYCSFYELSKYPSGFAGMVKILEGFIDQCAGWAESSKHSKTLEVEACSMNCRPGVDKDEKTSMTAAIKKWADLNFGSTTPLVSYHSHKEAHPELSDNNTADGDGDYESFVVLDSSGPQYFYNLRATLQSFEGERDTKEFSSLSSFALSNYPEETYTLFEKLYKLLDNCHDAQNQMQDFLSSERFLLENQTEQANQVLKTIQTAYVVAHETVFRLDFVSNPSDAGLEDILSANPRETVTLFIETVTSKLPPGSALDLLMIGKTGHGKSSTGNSILGKQKFVSSSDGDSVTSRTGVGWAEVDGRILKVVDTPGVCDTNLNKDEDSVSLAIQSISEAIANCPDGFHALLLIIRFGIRMTDEEKKAIALLKCILGEDIVRSHCVCVITHGDNFETEMKEKKMSFEVWCRSQKGFLKELFEECNYRCVLFNNKATDPKAKKAQLIQLIAKVDSLKASGTRYTNSLFEFAQRERRRIIVEEQVPQVSEDMMRDIQLILEYLNTMVSNTGEQGGYKEELSRLKERVDNLSNKVSEVENGQLGNLVDTVFSLAATIHVKMDEIADRSEPDSPDMDENNKTQPENIPDNESRDEMPSSSQAFVKHLGDLQNCFDQEVSPQNSMVTHKVADQVKSEVKKGGECFPASSLVVLASGKCISLQELQVGDEVLVRCSKGLLSYDTVYMFGHQEFDVSSEFLVLETAKQSVSVTRDHYVYCTQNEEEICVAAKNVKVRDCLLIVTKDGLKLEPVTKISYERKQGLFAPFTKSGTIVVDQALMSCYIDVLPVQTCHNLLWPVRQLYHLSPQALAFLNGSTSQHPVPRWVKFAMKLT